MPDEGFNLILVDGKHLLWRSSSVFQRLGVDEPNGDKKDTGGIYGFLRLALGSWIKFGAPGAVTMVAWDRAEGPRHRRAIYPHYKAKPPPEPKPGGHSVASQFDRASAATVERELMIESMREQEAKLKEILSLLGVTQASSPGWEADDVIATLCAKYAELNVGILSGDRDLLQLVDDTTTLIRPLTKGQFALETPATVRAEHGVSPLQILDLKALAGDPGDNVPGARGIGPKTAAKIIDVHGSWSRALDVALAKSEDKTLCKLVPHAESIRISAQLVTLNRAAPLEFIRARRDGRKAFMEMTKLRFNSLMADGRREQLMVMGGP